jgi:DNA-binding transcriptional LysR family regulator
MQSALSHLSLHKIAVFCAVADHGSVTRAAEQLAIAQPVVTAHVRALSDKLGVALTRRRGRRIELTEEGRRVHAWGADLLRRARDLEQALAETREGRRGST